MSGLRSELLQGYGVRHGFGTRDAQLPPGVVRPVQVHGTEVMSVREVSMDPIDADAVVSDRSGVAVGIVTADCVPVLLASTDGAVVGAIHAGWRGLAAGILARGVAAAAALRGDSLVACVGPAAGGCCYEVDAPVLDALGAAHPAALPAHVRASRPGHAWLDLAGVARDALVALGLEEAQVERIAACTICDAERFHSYRRDGASAGRLVHWIAAS